jgi:hypothetical protein
MTSNHWHFDRFQGFRLTRIAAFLHQLKTPETYVIAGSWRLGHYRRIAEF